MMNNTLAFNVSNGDSAHPQYNVRVDHNVFTNCPFEGPNFVDMTFSGAIRGVFDHNTVWGQNFIHHDGNQSNDWQALRFTLGTTNANYIEDNTFYNFWGIAGSEFGSSLVVRYNYFIVTKSDLFPGVDMHGNQGAGVYGAMGGEVYGNVFDCPNIGGNTAKIFHQRGGIGLCFYNLIPQNVGQGLIHYQEEFSDGLNGTTNPEPQHVSGSYEWNNRKNGSSGPFLEVAWQTDGTSTNTIAPNMDFWTNTPSFDGTVGMGMGPLASRPATATTGVGYWATTQSVSSTPSSCVGTNPATPISGTLYRATAPNTWTAYYTPLVYPHPLITAQSGDPVITVQPASQSIFIGQSVLFTVTASGSSTLSYQWQTNGVNAGTNGPALSLSGCPLAWSGMTVFVTVSDAAGAASSATAILTVNTDPAVVTPPQSITVQIGQTASWTVSAIGVTTLHYQWKRNGTVVGTDSTSFSLSNCQLSDSGSLIAVDVSDANGTTTSSSAVLTVSGQAPPTKHTFSTHSYGGGTH